MDTQEVEVEIDRTGHVRLRVRGAKGEQCLELTKDLEAALGGQVESREMTAEAYEAPAEQVQDWLRPGK